MLCRASYDESNYPADISYFSYLFSFQIIFGEMGGGTAMARFLFWLLVCYFFYQGRKMCWPLTVLQEERLELGAWLTRFGELL